MTALHGRPSAGSGGPAWGGGHLALDAIVAYVDEELTSGAQRRALEHLSRCPDCAIEVVAQTQARIALRGSSTPSLPSSLLHNLRDIPSHTELPDSPAGLSLGPSGEFVQLQRQPRAPRRRSRLGASVVVSGLAIGALVVTGNVISSAGGASAKSLPRTALVAPRSHFGRSATVEGAMLETPTRSPRTVPVTRPSAAPAPRSATASPAPLSHQIVRH